MNWKFWNKGEDEEELAGGEELAGEDLPGEDLPDEAIIEDEPFDGEDEIVGEEELSDEDLNEIVDEVEEQSVFDRLPKSRKVVYDFLVENPDVNRGADIARHEEVGYSSSTVYKALKDLAAAGLIDDPDGTHEYVVT